MVAGAIQRIYWRKGQAVATAGYERVPDDRGVARGFIDKCELVVTQICEQRAVRVSDGEIRGVDETLAQIDPGSANLRARTRYCVDGDQHRCCLPEPLTGCIQNSRPWIEVHAAHPVEADRTDGRTRSRSRIDQVESRGACARRGGGAIKQTGSCGKQY